MEFPVAFKVTETFLVSKIQKLTRQNFFMCWYVSEYYFSFINSKLLIIRNKKNIFSKLFQKKVFLINR